MKFGTSLRDKLKAAQAESLSSPVRRKQVLSPEQLCFSLLQKISTPEAISLSFPSEVLWSDLEGRFLKCSIDTLRLAGILRSAANDRLIHSVLYWPFSQKTPAFAHAFACLAGFMDGSRENGYRTLLWPAKANACLPFGDIRVNMDVLGSQAQIFANRYNNRYKTSSADFPRKLIALMNLKSSLGDAPKEYWPILSEIIPSFPSLKRVDAEVGWGDRPMRCLKHSRSAIPSSNLLVEMRSPLQAPDALFRLHPQYKVNDFEVLLKKSALGIVPNVALLDLRGLALHGVEKWWFKFNQLLFFLQGLPGRRAPGFNERVGVVILYDDPFRYARGLLHLRHLYNDFDRRVRRHESLTTTEHYSSSVEVSRSLPCFSDLPNLEVKMDFEASKVSDEMLELARKIRSFDSTAAESLKEAALRFRRLTSLPFGIAEFASGVREATDDSDAALAYLTRKLLWNTTWGKVVEHLKNGDYGSIHGQVERCLNNADEMILKCQDGTVASLWLRQYYQVSERWVIVCRSGLEANLLSELYEGRKDAKFIVLHAAEILTAGARLVLPERIDHLVVLSGPLALRVVFAFPAAPRRLTIFLDHQSIGSGLATLHAIRACTLLRQHHRLADILFQQLENLLASAPAARMSEILKAVQDIGAFLEYDLSFYGDVAGRDPSELCQIILEDRYIKAGKKTRVIVLDATGKFSSRYAKDLEPGDHIVLPTDSFDRFVRGLSDEGWERLRNLDTRTVMRRIKKGLEISFPGLEGGSLVQAVLTELHRVFPGCAISEHQVRYWVGGPAQISAAEEKVLQTRSARSAQDFLAFASVIGISEEYAREDLWPKIRRVRIERQRLGRNRNNLFEVLLLHPENVVRYSEEVSQEIVDIIHRESIEHALVVEEVR